jgi:hypothetical protein
VNEKMTGYGKFSWPNGDRYEGNFQNDQKNAYVMKIAAKSTI